MLKVHLDKRLLKSIKNFSRQDKARISKIVSLFREKGFYTHDLYLKKINKRIWEFKSGDIRLLFGIVKGITIVVSTFIKKTQKTPLKEIKLAEKRLSEYI